MCVCVCVRGRGRGLACLHNASNARFVDPIPSAGPRYVPNIPCRAPLGMSEVRVGLSVRWTSEEGERGGRGNVYKLNTPQAS